MSGTVHDLFPIPLFEDNLPVPVRILEYIKSVEYFRHDTGYMSHKRILDDPQMSVIKKLITQRVETYFYDCCQFSKKAKPVLISSWLNLHKNGDYGQPHFHENSVISFVWYPLVDDQSGTFVVYPKMNLFGNTLSFPKNQNNKYNSGNLGFYPRNGDLYIFPSHMVHGVQELRHEFDRYSLAGDYMITSPLRITPDSDITVNCEFK
tara:strand:- start:82 stop:699 length:618 start_codon:yes stop_codon:yes gene_type:complete